MRYGMAMGFGGLAIGLAVGLLIGTGTLKGDVQPSGDSLNGVWRLSSGAAEGQALSETELKSGKLIIKEAHYTVTLDHIGTVTGIQTLDATQSPKTIDITDGSGPTKGQTCLGIYEVNGDEFRVAFAGPGKPRPSSFETQPDSGEWMHVWHRVQE